MKMNSRLSGIILALVVAVGLGACNKPAPPPATTPAPAPKPAAPPPAAPPPAATPISVGAIDLGSTIGTDNRVTAPAAVFTPKDTVYASVGTNGASTGATLVARWSFQDGQVVAEDTQTIAPSGPAVTTFHIVKPDGFPVGKYKVDVSLNGTPAGTREFDIR